MEKITLIWRPSTTDPNKQVRLRFRLREGRGIEIYHKSNIMASPTALAKLNPDGSVKPRVAVFNAELFDGISDEMEKMRRVYRRMNKDGIALNSETFENYFSQDEARSHKGGPKSLLQEFDDYIITSEQKGVFGERRRKTNRVCYNKLTRFLTINGCRDIRPVAFDDDALSNFRQFLFDEYLYVPRYRGLYVGLNESQVPKKRLGQNTAATYMKVLQTFLSDLECREIISKSPFRKIPKKERRLMIREQYTDPVCPTKEEFMKVLHTEVPQELQAVKDAFCVQCAFGLRISDFQRLSMKNVSVTDDGIPYIHYIPIKTRGEDMHEKETPIMRFALDIIKKNGCNFQYIKYFNGQHGYNVKIKELLRFCGLDRSVVVQDGDDYCPLWSVASSKICRKAFVDMLNKVQINMYAAGLHKAGSEAVMRYTNIGLRDRFVLMCAAFDEQPYRVDKQLNIIG